jgi:DNA polymerase-1
MIAIDREIRDQQKDIRMIMQVHDELVFEVANAIVEEKCEQICSLMSAAGDLSVPLLVEAGVGKNWDEAH